MGKCFTDDNSILVLSPNAAEALKMFPGDIARVEGPEGMCTILVLLVDKDLEDGECSLNCTARENVNVDFGGRVSITHMSAYIGYLKHVNILPFADTIHGLTGSLLDDFLVPYFKETYRPLAKGDHVACRKAQRTVDFKVIDFDRQEFGIVARDTIIQMEGKPLQR